MIWGEDVRARLPLQDVNTIASGVVMLTYRVAA
jgi:hypothetical protein